MLVVSYKSLQVDTLVPITQLFESEVTALLTFYWLKDRVENFYQVNIYRKG